MGFTSLVFLVFFPIVYLVYLLMPPKGRAFWLLIASYGFCISFGFKFGIPMEADLVLDVRCLPNPFYDQQLRPKTGLDPAVRDYVMENEETRGFLSRYTALLDYLLPL